MATHNTPDSVQLTTQEIGIFTQKFHSFDQNGDGYISIEELEIVEVSFDMNPTQEQLAKEMKSVDIDGDGRINLQEFLVMMAQQKAHDIKKEEEELKQTFDELDEDGNGFIDVTELKHAIVDELGHDETDEDLNEMMNKADTNADGLISYNEFVEMVFKNEHANSSANEAVVMERVTNTVNDELNYVLIVSVIVMVLIMAVCGICKVYHHFKYRNTQLYEALAVECVTVDDTPPKRQKNEPELQHLFN